jgi:hypothetical protein
MLLRIKDDDGIKERERRVLFTKTKIGDWI